MSETAFSAAKTAILDRLVRAPIWLNPFPHYVVRNVFPVKLYEEMLANLPNDEPYTDATYRNRRMAKCEGLGEPWGEIAHWVGSAEFLLPIMQRFASFVRERFGETEIGVTSNVRLVRDSDGYEIKVHTDHPSKLLSFLFYLPRHDGMRDLGTRLYEPINPDFRCDGMGRHAFENFREAGHAPFMPNSGLCFFKTDRSFHGVPAINRPGLTRNVLLWNVYKADTNADHERLSRAEQAAA